MSTGGDKMEWPKSPFGGIHFSGIFLAWMLSAAVLAIYFLSYFNRVFGSLVSWAIRTYTWSAYGIYIDIQALQVSLLGGRIFFTGLRYYGNNETIFVQNGYITWSYWQWRVRDVDISSPKGDEKGTVNGKSAKAAKLPCRINVIVSGLEWFIYNRSAAYDAVLAGMTDSGLQQSADAVPKEEEGPSKLRRRTDRAGQAAPVDQPSLSYSSAQATQKSSMNGFERPVPKAATFQSSCSDEENGAFGDKRDKGDELPLLLQLYPINVEVTKAAVVMGNDNTRAIMVVTAKGLTTEIDATSTETPDPYRQLYKIKLDHPLVEMRDNRDFKEGQTERAVRERLASKDTTPIPKRTLFRRYRRQTVSHLRNLVPFWRKSVESFSGEDSNVGGTGSSQVPGSNHWQGLSRYLNEQDRDEKLRWASVEYAAVNTVLDTPEASITVYWDTPGMVAPRRPGTVERAKGPVGPRSVNGDDPPQWGINVSIKGGSVNYGPWADRHRAEIQRVFFPGLCKDAKPAKPLPVGANRVPTQFKLYLELDEEVNLRVPIKEESKNWRFRGKEPPAKNDKARDKRSTKGRLKQSDQGAAAAFERQYGWLDVKIAANSTISYYGDMLAGPNGFGSSLDLDLPKTEISSSINHELLWRSGKQRISCDLSTPLKWNALRQWRFDIDSDDLELFILRDHVFLLIDLIDDWSSGPPAEYLVFTPFKYFLDLHFRNLKLYLNVNDGNIINKPTDLEDNAYIIINSPLLESSTCILLDKFRPAKSAIPFDIRAETASISLHVPPWNTQATFLKSLDMGYLENLVVDGKYHYNSTTSPGNTDTLVLNVGLQSPVVHLFGFVIRYCLKMKDNYFGDDIHFKTLEEYQEMLRTKDNPGVEVQSKPPTKKSNDLDVILAVRVDDPKIYLPVNLYSSDRHIQIEMASITADLRFTNYYMDLDLVLSPLNLSLGSGDHGMETPMSAATSTQLFIDGVNVYGNRLFGLPPTEPTYLCNWDLSVGAVSGECTGDFLSALVSGGKAFGFTFDDDENALIPFSDTVMYDVTFLRIFVHSIRIWLHVDEAAFLLSTGAIDVNYNDWARSHYSKRANIKIPDIQVSCINAESASRHRSRSHGAVETELLVQTSIHLATIARKVGFSNERKLQQELVRREDQRTHRTEFLILPRMLNDLVPDVVDPTAQPVPPVPSPALAEDVQEDNASLSSSGTSKHSKGLRRKSSFLSVSSSSQSSILRPTSSRRSSRHSRMSRMPGGLRPLTALDGQEGTRGSHRRDISVSTGHHSAFYSAHGDLVDRALGKDEIHNTVAFSSQYFAPYFPLETVLPDTSETLLPSVEDDNGAKAPPQNDFGLEDIDPDILNEDHAYSSLLVELPAGLTAFVTPSSLKNIATLINALQPADPEDILDSLQMDGMSNIFTMQSNEKMKSKISDVLLRIPRANVRFVNLSDMDSSEPPQEEQDQYDFHLNDLAFATRTEDKWQDSFDPTSHQSRSSFHFRLGLIEVSAAERLATHTDTQTAVKAHIESVMVSKGTKDVTYLDGEIGGIQSSLSSEKIEYLASLIHRTSRLATDLGNLFSRTTSREAELLKYVTYRLVMDGQAAIDPTFLIRPSAVLRSAKRHLRTFDSWKLVTRLRQMWFVSDANTKDMLRLDCLGPSLDVPVDVKQQVVKAFEKWRSWDLLNLNQAVLLSNIFGSEPDAKSAPPNEEPPFLAVLRLRDTRIILDPGPRQNEISFSDVTARFQSKETTDNVPQTGADSNATSITTLNIYCSDAAVKLNWDLCELAEDVLRLYARFQQEGDEQPSEEKQASSSASKVGKTYHVVVAVAKGEMAFDAINLHSTSLGYGMKASLLMRQHAKDRTDTDFILSNDAVTSRLRSHNQVLGDFQLREPSVLISHTLDATETTDSHNIKARVSSRELSLLVQQDPIGLLEVVDLLIKDEAAQLYRLKQQLPSSPEPQQPTRKIKDRLSAIEVSLAMFLDEYYISLPLLQSLTYCISGVVARAAMEANFGKELQFNFDIKENAHEMRIEINNEPRSLSLLQIPPTNGIITSQMSETENVVTVMASVELIQLDASAVYGLLSALNRPEISSAINDVQEQVQLIKGHASELVGTSNRPSSVQEKTPSEDEPPKASLVYDVHVTFAGLDIFGNAPLKSEVEPLAIISFGLDSVILQLQNRMEAGGPILDDPEVHVNLHKATFAIDKGTSESDVRTCGSVAFGALVTATTKLSDEGAEERHFNIKSDGFDVALSPETVSTVVDVLGYMGDKIKDLDTSRELELLRKLRQSRPKIAINDEQEEEPDFLDSFLSSIRYSFEIRKMQISWLVLTAAEEPSEGKEDLVFTLERIELGTRTRNSARLIIENFQLQTVPTGHDKKARSANSALLPEVIFNVAYVSTSDARRIAFQAVGKSLDLRLTSGFIIPVSNVADSISLSVKNVQQASQHWNPPSSRRPSQAETTPQKSSEPRKPLLGNKRMESFLVDADFAGAVVYLAAQKAPEESADSRASRATRAGLAGKYGQFTADDSGSSTVLKSPGVALKVEYRDPGTEDPSLYGEIKIDASSNILYPSFVPLLMDLTSSIKEVVRDESDKKAAPQETLAKAKAVQEDYILDPSAVIGRLKLNLGLRICKQEFSLSCQPIARVAATAGFDDVYFAINTVRSAEQGNFFAISGAFTNLQASVQHVYSRESTGKFKVESIVLSLMNSKHVSGISGVSAILKVSPMDVWINAKQLQDFLLFREIWMPREVRQSSTTPVSATLQAETSQGHLVQRYQQVAATAAFPWTATISISALNITVDLGQAIGKSTFSITDFWVSSKKTSDWEQNLCLGFHKMGVDSHGRMSGFVAVEDLKLRTSIQWPEREQALNETPMIQASLSFSQFRIKAAFDYQAFLVADITSMDFLMYNVRQTHAGSGDRLVAVFDGDAVQIFGTTTSAAQGVALYQAFTRLVQERRASFETSLKEIEKFMKRKSISISPQIVQRLSIPKSKEDDSLSKSPISLDTDVVVTLKALNLGVFPNTFSNHQVFKMEALNAQARFAASVEGQRLRVHSILDLTLGQLRIGLAGVMNHEAPKALNELAVEDVVQSATGSRGGTILKVPKVAAVMQTWQTPNSKKIDYIFKSAFEGKVEVGWNYSRISYIRNMWASHSMSLAQAYGKEISNPLTAIKVTGVPGEGDPSPSIPGAASGSASKQEDAKKKQQGKITAEVHVPQSKYEYTALEPPIIETPQLRDMGEATPPLEWIGLNRDRLPNLTHQIVIVSLLELAGEVEDAYGRILGSS